MSWLFKMYYPGEWRLSEDLDFTALGNPEWDKAADALWEEVPNNVRKLSQMEIALKTKPRINQDPPNGDAVCRTHSSRHNKG